MFGLITVRVIAVLTLIGSVVWLNRDGGRGRRREAIPAQNGGYALVTPDYGRAAVVIGGLPLLTGVLLWLESLLGHPSEDLGTLAVLGVAFVIMAALVAVGGNRVAIRVDEQGIEKMRWWREPKRIQWNEVESVYYSEWFDHRLVVSGRGGEKLWVSHQLCGMMGLLILMEEQLDPEQYRAAADRILPMVG